jgi:hypothetical protein
MLQVFYLYVAKVDLDVAYTYCKHMFKVFSGISYICLQVFYLNVVYTCNGFQMFLRRFRKCFTSLFQSVSSVFFCMLQLLHLDVSKVERVLHMGCMWEAASGADDVRGGAGPLLVRSLVSPSR